MPEPYENPTVTAVALGNLIDQAMGAAAGALAKYESVRTRCEGLNFEVAHAEAELQTAVAELQDARKLFLKIGAIKEMAGEQKPPGS